MNKYIDKFKPHFVSLIKNNIVYNKHDMYNIILLSKAYINNNNKSDLISFNKFNNPNKIIYETFIGQSIEYYLTQLYFNLLLNIYINNIPIKKTIKEVDFVKLNDNDSFLLLFKQIVNNNDNVNNLYMLECYCKSRNINIFKNYLLTYLKVYYGKYCI